ncbi:MAG: heavy metal translocating P-type ATPase [Luteolibacter sp.]
MHDHAHHDHGAEHDHVSIHWRWLLISAIGCGVFAGIGIYLERQPELRNLAYAAYVTAFLCGGWEAALDAFERLKSFRVDIHFLMLSVAIGAVAIGAWWEGAILLFLFSLSHALEAMAQARTEREIRGLFRETPKTARVLEADGSMREVPVDGLVVGQRLHVRPGDQFPADARVIEGKTSADESMLSGESLAIEKSPGDTVFSGTLNGYGAIVAEVMRPPSESAHAKIIRLIQDAQESKAPSQRFTDRFGSGYTLGLLGLTALLFCVWHWGFGIPAFESEEKGGSAFYRAMTFLVVCSPCALVISIPSAVLAGIASGARRGILFRGGIALENLATVTRVAMDKTGTLTRGEPELVDIEVSRPEEESLLLRAAAALSGQSNHPLSEAIFSRCIQDMGENPPPAADLVSLPGQGLRGVVEDEEVILGKRTLFEDHPWISELPDPEPGMTEVLVTAGDLAGRILLRDALRPEAASLVASLRENGIRVAMLTGDRPEAAAMVSKELDLDDVRAAMTPEDKVSAIRAWQQQGEIVAMVGDGVNDAPSLATADISIGMGLRGSDAVLEQADIILTKDRIERVRDAFLLSRRCRTIIRQNLAISLGVVLLLGISALGAWIPLPLGVLGHEGSTVLVVANSLRLLWQKAVEK